MSEEHDVALWQREEADAAVTSLDEAYEWVSDLLDEYGLGRPDGLAGGLDQVGAAFRLASWLHAEQEWKLGEYYWELKRLAGLGSAPA